MDVTAFETWLNWITSLTEGQRRRTLRALACSDVVKGPEIERNEAALAGPAGRAVDTDATARHRAVEAVNVAEIGGHKVAIIGCPHCGGSDVVRWGKVSDLPRYRCKACARTFNALTKTPLAKLRMKEKWSRRAEAMIDGVSLASPSLRIRGFRGSAHCLLMS